MIRQQGGAGEQMIERKCWRGHVKVKQNRIEVEYKVGLMCYRTDELTGKHSTPRHG